METETSILRLLNSLSTSDYNDIDYLKMQARLESIKLRLPASSSQLLKNLIEDQNITPVEFREKFEQILNSANAWTWKLNLFVYDLFGNIKNFIFQLYWTEILLFLGFFFFVFLLDKKFNIHKPFVWFKKSNEILLERTFALLCYLAPYVDICFTYLPKLQQRYPYLGLLLTDFMRWALQIYQRISYIQLLYFMIAYGLLIRNRIPKSRFIRFNLMSGIIILLIQGNIITPIYYLLESKAQDPEEIKNFAFIGFFLNLIILLPFMFRAVLGRYPTNAFIRDNIEVHLGRDGPDFKWWDR
jgi:hypothetical protein